MKTVTFCGHSNIYPEKSSDLQKRVEKVVERLIAQGADEFLLGGYGDFDILCAETVKSFKVKYPHITSVLVIPYLNRKYNTYLYDCTEYPPLETVPKPFAIIKRNEYMVDKAEIVVAYINHTYGGAYKTMTYARRKNKTIVNVAIHI